MSERKKIGPYPVRRLLTGAAFTVATLAGFNAVNDREAPTPPEGPVALVNADTSIESQVGKLVSKGLIERGNLPGRSAESVRRNGGVDVLKGKQVAIRVDKLPEDQDLSQDGIQFDGGTIDVDSAQSGIQPENGEDVPKLASK